VGFHRRFEVLPGGQTHATGGDVRRLSGLFGLRIQATTRYTATLDHPDLLADQPSPP
jgi:hypothetical protein